MQQNLVSFAHVFMLLSTTSAEYIYLGRFFSPHVVFFLVLRVCLVSNNFFISSLEVSLIKTFSLVSIIYNRHIYCHHCLMLLGFFCCFGFFFFWLVFFIWFSMFILYFEMNVTCTYCLNSFPEIDPPLEKVKVEYPDPLYPSQC
jgi:hypothetical protein